MRSVKLGRLLQDDLRYSGASPGTSTQLSNREPRLCRAYGPISQVKRRMQLSAESRLGSWHSVASWRMLELCGEQMEPGPGRTTMKVHDRLMMGIPQTQAE